MVYPFTRQQNMIRSLAVIVPALILDFVWLHGVLQDIIGLFFAWVICFLFLQCFSLKNSWAFTGILSCLISFCFAAYNTFLSYLQVNVTSVQVFIENILSHAAIYTLISFCIALPGWLLFWGLDACICKILHRPDKT